MLRRALLAAAAVVLIAPAGAVAAEPWQDARQVTDGLFDAQTELVLSGPAEATKDTARARAAYSGELRDTLREADPAADRVVAAALRDAERAARADDQAALAAARGSVRAGLLRGSYAVTVEAAGRGDAATARRWLLLREYRTATRFTRPGAQRDARAGPARARARSPPTAARQAVAKDLLDAYQARLRELLSDARRGIKENLPARRAEAAAQAAGYFAILAPRYAEDRGAAAEREASAAFDALPEAGDGLPAALDAADRALRGLHRRAVHARGGRAPRAAAAPVPRARAGRVRPRREGRPGHARLRDPGGRGLPDRRGGRVRRPARPARQARRAPHADRGRGADRARPARRGRPEAQVRASPPTSRSSV